MICEGIIGDILYAVKMFSLIKLRYVKVTETPFLRLRIRRSGVRISPGAPNIQGFRGLPLNPFIFGATFEKNCPYFFFSYFLPLMGICRPHTPGKILPGKMVPSPK